MPETPFGRAVLDGVQQILTNKAMQAIDIYSLEALLQQDNCEVEFALFYQGEEERPSIEPLQDYVTLSPADIAMLEALELPPDGRVADLGCGIGRHLAYIRHRYPGIECCGVEHCDVQRTFATENFAGPKHFVSSMSELQEDFDAILMMGNGLGFFGDEEGIVDGLSCWGRRLKPGGYFVIESGAHETDVETVYLSASYKEWSEPFFPWFGVSPNHLSGLLKESSDEGIRYNVTIHASRFGSPYYIAIARRL